MVSRSLVRVLLLALVITSTLTLAACEVVGDIFQAGVVVGVLMIVGIVALVGFIAAKMRS